MLNNIKIKLEQEPYYTFLRPIFKIKLELSVSDQ